MTAAREVFVPVGGLVEDGDVTARRPETDGESQPGRPGADDGDLHVLGLGHEVLLRRSSLVNDCWPTLVDCTPDSMCRTQGGDMRLAHLSDPHLRSGPWARLPPAACISRWPGCWPSILVRTAWSSPVTSPDDGEAESYAQLAELLEGYPLPVHLATGNHDDRAALESVFGGTPHLGDRCRDVVDGDVTLVVLDSLDDRPGTDHASGWLGEEQLAWLDDLLAARRDRPAVLALHHPPAPVGIPFLDGMRLRDADALAEVVARHPQVVRVLAGHVHRPVTTGFAGTTVTTAPSTFRQSTLTLQGWTRRWATSTSPPPSCCTWSTTEAASPTWFRSAMRAPRSARTDPCPDATGARDASRRPGGPLRGGVRRSRVR